MKNIILKHNMIKTILKHNMKHIKLYSTLFFTTLSISLHYKYIIFIFNNEFHFFFLHCLFLGIISLLVRKVYQGLSQRDISFRKSDFWTFLLGFTLPLVLNYYGFSMFGIFITTISVPLFLEWEWLLFFKLHTFFGFLEKPLRIKTPEIVIVISKIIKSFDFNNLTKEKDLIYGALSISSKSDIPKVDVDKSLVLSMDNNPSNNPVLQDNKGKKRRYDELSPVESGSSHQTKKEFRPISTEDILSKTAEERSESEEYRHFIQGVVQTKMVRTDWVYFDKNSLPVPPITPRPFVSYQHIMDEKLKVFQNVSAEGEIPQYKYLFEVKGKVSFETFKYLCTNQGPYVPWVADDVNVPLSIKVGKKVIPLNITTGKDHPACAPPLKEFGKLINSAEYKKGETFYEKEIMARAVSDSIKNKKE